MKDKVARALIEQLAARIGCHVEEDNGIITLRADGEKDSIQFLLDISGKNIDQNARLAVILNELMESAKPVCSKCGQKIQAGIHQNGLKKGDVEKVAAAVRKADGTKRK